MKFILPLVLFFAACGQATSDYVKSVPDTVFTTVHYSFNWATNDFRVSTARKIVLDTFSLQAVDSLTSVKKWVRDSVYLLPFADTVRKNGKPVLDSLGRPKIDVRWINLPKQFLLIDYNKNWK